MSAIRELIEAVEAGALQGLAVEFADVLGAHAQHAAQAYHRDMNAALSLMAAVLPDHAAVIDTGDNSVKMHERIFWDDGQPTDDWEWLFEVSSDTPARALLLAILKAMEARQ